MLQLNTNRKMLKNLDVGIIIITLIIVIFGCINIYYSNTRSGFSYARLQFLWLVLGVIVISSVLLIDYAIIKNYTPILYWVSIAFLIFNDLFSQPINGASGWIKIGSRTLQPAEFVKLTLILMLAKKLDDMECQINNLKNFFILLIYSLIPMVFIVIQPDMGMMMVCFFIILGIFFIAGLNLKVIITGLVTLFIAIVSFANSSILPRYMKMRLISFINPKADDLSYGYQVAQALIGIGSGGVLGSGPKVGANAAKGFVSTFVPASHTDFIFAVIAEKWGFIGCLVLLALFSILIIRFIQISKVCKDIFGRIVCIGVASEFIFLIMQNIGMNISIMPVTGVVLPLLSSGGSSMITNLLEIGLILNISMRKNKINF